MTFVVDYDANYDVIRVLHDDVLIYKDTGISPITFKVNCIRDRCPPGYCECKTDEYPGYCCSDCASNTKQIHDMRTALKVKNGG
ncbi:hypothetical protein [Nostoc sp. DSM 114161]|uniref:hypothetical protein n=1 Tax=Nostoc sp. DSM 114161 TaxID=3440143 RepID=UPI0040459A0C